LAHNLFDHRIHDNSNNGMKAMKRRTTTGERLRTLAFAVLTLAGAAAPAAAQDGSPASFFVQGGSGEDGVRAASVGVQWPWAWRTAALGGEWSARTELFGSMWRAHAVGGGHENFFQLGLVPLLRYRFAEGRSPWFVEGGIGLSVTDKRFVSRDKEFGTSWNFSDNLAVGRSFGEQGRQEVSLRLQHTSNGGLKKPNPGLNLVLLRYASAF
jgi:lipid A 3-O-deacylase